MANETGNNYSDAVNNLMETVGKLQHQQVELVTNGIKSATAAFEPLSKTAIELTGTVMNALNQILQNISTTIAPKK